MKLLFPKNILFSYPLKTIITFVVLKKIRMKTILKILFLLIPALIWAQDKKIAGYIMFENEPVPETIVIIEAGKSYTSVTNTEGFFSILLDENIEKYTITYEHAQFKPEHKELSFVEGQTLYLSFETEEDQVLETLVIDQSNKNIKRFADKTVIDVENMTILNNGSVFEAINKLPGVLVAANGQIAHNGKLAAIFLDGEPTGMDGDQLTNFLKNLPANSVKNIEIIDNPGAKYSATFSGTIINVVTKNAKIEGVSGSIMQHNSINSRIKNTTSAQLMFKKNKWTWNLNSGYTHHEANVYAANTFSFQKDELPVKAAENYWNQQWYQSFFLRNNWQLKLSDATQFTLKYNYNHLYSKPKSFGDIENQFGDTKDTYRQHSQTRALNNMHEVQFIYSQKLDTLGTQFTITSNTQWQFNDNDNALYVKNKLASRILTESRFIYSQSKADFETPLTRLSGTLTAGVHYTHSLSANNGLYQWEGNAPYIPYDFNYTNTAVYSSVSANIKKLMISAGLRMEALKYRSVTTTDSLNLNETYTNLFPTITLKYPVASGIYLSAGYNKRMNLPGAAAFNPNTTSRNSLLLSDGGNPFLKPQINHNISTSVTIFDYIYFNYNLTLMPNQNVLFYEVTPEGGLQSKYHNMANARSQSFHMGFPLPYAIFTKGIKNLIENRKGINPDELSFTYVNFGWFKTKYDNIIPERFQKSTAYIFTYSQFYLKNNTRLFITYYNMFKGVMNLYELNKPAQNLNISLNKKFYDNKWSVTVGVDNVLNTDGFDVNVFGNGLQMRSENWNEKRMFKVGVIFNFGSFKDQNQPVFPQTQPPFNAN